MLDNWVAWFGNCIWIFKSFKLLYIYSLHCTTLPYLHASQLYKKNPSLNSGNKCNNSLCSESCRVFSAHILSKEAKHVKRTPNISTDKVMKIAVFEKLMQISSEWISLTFIYFTFYKKKNWGPFECQKSCRKLQNLISRKNHLALSKQNSTGGIARN